MNSWLPSIRWPDLTATARAIDTASVSPSTVSASAVGKIVRQVSRSNDGSDSAGMPDGSAPRTGTFAVPVAASAYANRLPATIATIM